MTKEEHTKMILDSESYAWCSKDQQECCKMLFDIFGGEHHLQRKVKPWGLGIQYNHFGELATYDFQQLTWAVLMAHDRMIRFSILPSGRGMIRLVLHKRHTRDVEKFYDRHPTIEQAIENFRKYYKPEE